MAGINKDNLHDRVRRLHVRSRKLVDSLFAGSYHSVFKGPGLEFNEVRDYHYGDDVRFIDWNVTSRMSTPYSKTFREERELIMLVLFDVSASLSYRSIYRDTDRVKEEYGNDKRETAGNIFALLALAAQANSDMVGSILFSDTIERIVFPGNSKSHVLRQISEILGYVPDGKGSNLALALKTAVTTLKRRSIVVIISDFKTGNYKTELGVIASKHDVIAIRITEPADYSFPPAGLLELEDPETGRSLEVYGRSEKFRKAYSEFQEDQRNEWIKICRKTGTDMLEVGINDDPAESLLSFFRRRKVSR